MKKNNHNTQKRCTAMLAILTAFTVKAWVLLVMGIIVVVSTVGAIYYVIVHVIPAAQPPAVNANQVNYNVQVIDAEGPPPIIVPPFIPMDVSPSITNAPQKTANSPTFSFQYGMCSTNPQAMVWVATGTNLIQTVSWPTNGADTIYGIPWTLVDSSNCYDIIYEVNGYLARCTAILTNGTYKTTDTNLFLVVARSTNAGLSGWQPIYTNSLPVLDVPYTFTDTNPALPSAFYRVGFQ